MCGVLNYIYVFLFLLYRLSAFLLIARVSQSSDTRMNVTNLARVFGPTIVGHAVADPDPMTILQDTKRQPKVWWLAHYTFSLFKKSTNEYNFVLIHDGIIHNALH